MLVMSQPKCPPSTSQLLKNRYYTFQPVGEGTYGVLYLIQDMVDPAHPFLVLKKLKYDHSQMLLREIGIMRRLTHRSVIQLRDVLPRPRSNSAHIVMEYAPMDLRNFLTAFFCTKRKQQPLPPPTSPPVPAPASLSASSSEHGSSVTSLVGLRQVPSDVTSRSRVPPLDSELPSPLVASAVAVAFDAISDRSTTSPQVAAPSQQVLAPSNPRRRMPIEYVRSIMYSLLEGCNELHSRGVTHRDLKPENILLYPFGYPNSDAAAECDGEETSQDFLTQCLHPDTMRPIAADLMQRWIHFFHCPNHEACETAQRCLAEPPSMRSAANRFRNSAMNPVTKIGDFGSARVVASNWKCSEHPTDPRLWERYHTGGVTTLRYRSPEALCHGMYGFPADIWAAGCMLYELVTGRQWLQTNELTMANRLTDPDESDWGSLMQMLTMNGFPPAEEWCSFAHPLVYTPEVVAHMPKLGYPMYGVLQRDRAILEELLTIDGYDLFTRMMVYNPSKRISALEALHHPFFSADVDYCV